MANNLTVTYKGNTIHTASASGSATLETGGTWCEGDIGLSYSFEGYALEVTVTNGTATSVTASLSGVTVSLNYNSTSGKWVGQLIPGTWTLTATDGTRTQTDTVTVTTTGVYAVTLRLQDIPNGYTQLQYIQSSGTQYINTGVDFSGGGKIDCQFMWVNTPVAYSTIFGVGINVYPWKDTKVRRGAGSAVVDVLAFAAVDNATPASANTLYTFTGTYRASTKKFSGVLNGSSKSLTGSETIPNYPLFLFAGNNENTTSGIETSKRIYYFRVYATNNTTLRLNLVPARRNSDSVLGMYDTVNNDFYTNAGTGTFTAGPAV